MTSTETAELVAKIKTAFATRAYPSDDQLGCRPDDYDSSEIAEAFRGLHWSEPSPELLEYHYNAPTFFSDAAWRFYAPAYMLAELEHSEQLSMGTEWFIHSLLPPVVRAEQLRAEEAQGLPSIEALGLSPEETEKLHTVRAQSIEIVERGRDRAAEAAADAAWQAKFEAKMGELSAQEKAVIREFLEYLQTHSPHNDDVRLALERYWRQF